ncbi:PQQ-dependent sugar dehydrogenase [Roseateles sp.]|uniref:PQQ-dependent sugar dehydrogenase n=1 Tax=Roseateles sp. TaxID=1971397 RepID=UPI003BA7F906
MKKYLLGLLLPIAAQAQAQVLKTELVAQGFQSPWAIAALPDGEWLVTEKPGALRKVDAKGKVSAPLKGVPKVDAVGQGGLLDLVLDSGFASNRQLYFCFTEAGAGGNGTALAKARLNAEGTALEQVQVIFRQVPKMEGRHHYGCRIVEAADGSLFMTLGERFMGMQRAQQLDNHLGKIVRITKEGQAPADNPFTKTTGALPEIYSYGHRNPQGLLLDAQGQLWAHEHGPQGGDELNRVQAGKNYGWPVITYGENYGGGKIGEGLTAKEGMEQPTLHWTPSIAPSGLVQLSSKAYGESWQGSFFLGSLKFRYLERVQFQAGKPVVQQKLLQDVGRLRDVRQGSDGLLYVLTENEPAQLLRLRPGP